MPFGKHKGTAMANVPAPYLLWLHDTWINDSARQRDEICDVKEYIHDNIDLLQSEAAKTYRS